MQGGRPAEMGCFWVAFRQGPVGSASDGGEGMGASERPVRQVWAAAGAIGMALLLGSVAATADDGLFGDRVPALRLRIEPEAEQRLRDEPRRYAPAALVEEGGQAVDDVAVKLKGAVGSYRDYDDRPGLTVHVARREPDRRFHGLEKFHLNNAVQDESFANEWLFAQLAAAAGLPAPRVGHVRLWINERDLGIYVLREGFDRPFLERHFRSAAGNLYDGGFCQDVDAELEKDSGDGVDDRSDIAALVDACRTEDSAARRDALAARLDVDRFLTFVALEAMAGHWDGYTANVNNYRLLFPGDDGPAVFLPHGADQLFGDPAAPILDPPNGLVARAVMADPTWREAWRERVRELLPLFDPPDALVSRVEDLRGRLGPVFTSIDPELAATHAERCADLIERLQARAESLRSQAEAPEPQPVVFDETGRTRPAGWYPGTVSDGVELTMADADGGPRLTIRADTGTPCTASWRCRMRLPRGTYRLRMPAGTAAVAAVADEKGRGAGVRISGEPRDQGLDGDSRAILEHEFTVAADSAEVELVAELRATGGTATFDAFACELVRLGDPEDPPAVPADQPGADSPEPN